MEVKLIPAFYCCYLLRSTVRHASLYIGSTPDPRRRLAQHNGQVKGGAVRTSSVTLRPWEMTCLIAGFPSNIAALQFEWAWQNAHLTRHIPHQERISFATTRTKSSPKSGRTRIRPGRPKTSLTDKLSNLHLLLRVPYFSRWPLELRFLSEDVYHLWQVWCQRVDAQIGPEIKVWLDKPRQDYEPASHVNSEGPQGRRELEVVGGGGVKGIDPTYACLRPVLEKSQMLLEADENENLACSLCKQDINPRHDLVTICPQGNCASLHHMTCLSSHFLKAGQGSSMVPASGRCPRCKAHLSWVDLMKAMSLRVRDEKGVYKMLKSKKEVAAPSAVQAAALGDDSSGEFDVGQFGDDQLMGADIVDDDDDSDDDGDEEEYDAGSVTSARSDTSSSSRIRAAFRATVDTKLPTVIEDSDDDVIDLLSD